MNCADCSLRDQYEAHGWALARGLFAPEEARRIAGYVDELAGLPERRGSVWKYSDDDARLRGEHVLSRIERFRAHHPGLSGVLADVRLLSILAALFGEPAVLFKDKLNLKLPGSAGFALHQDAQAGWTRYGKVQVTAMVSLDATTKLNGCLELGVGPRLRSLRGRLFEPLEEADVPELTFHAIETQPGDVLFFDALVAHRSAPNQTAAARRVLYATYNPASQGDVYERYFADKYASYPPDIERRVGLTYRYRV